MHTLTHTQTHTHTPVVTRVICYNKNNFDSRFPLALIILFLKKETVVG